MSPNDAIKKASVESLPFEPDEGKGEGILGRIIEEATIVIARLLMQIIEVQKWHKKAFQRDRGAVD